MTTPSEAESSDAAPPPMVPPSRVPDRKRVRPIVRTLAAFGAERLRRAIAAYWELSEPPQPRDRTPRGGVSRRPALAEVAVDAATAVEALLSALRHERKLSVPRDKILDVLRAVLAPPDAAPALAADGPVLEAALRRVRRLRNAYLHGGVLPKDVRPTLEALHDTLALGLRLTAAFHSLRAASPTVDEELWKFTGQPEFVTGQVRRAFSARRFEGLRARLRVETTAGAGHFFLGGALSVVSEVRQYFWGFGGGHTGLIETFPDIEAEIGVVTPPPESERSAEGSATHEGALELVARDLAVQFDGLGPEDNPLLEPIYLREGGESEWMHGPDNIELTWLRLTVPYRVHTTWYPTREPRQHILSQFIDYDAEGEVRGKLRFFLPGHFGKPSLRGTATLRGCTSACRLGEQLAEWSLYRFDEEAKHRSGMWAGVTRLSFWSDLTFDIKFSHF